MADVENLSAMRDRLEIREVVENWVFWRDSCNWEALRAAYTPDGRMSSGASSGTIEQFIAFSREFTEKGLLRPTHLIGSSLIETNGDKAIAETRVTVLLRGVLEGVEVDVTAYARQYDRFVRHEGRWLIKMRTPIYDRDRMDVVHPGSTLSIDPERLAGYPSEYKYMSYLNDALGVAPANLTLPTGQSAAEAQLRAEGAAWLRSED